MATQHTASFLILWMLSELLSLNIHGSAIASNDTPSTSAIASNIHGSAIASNLDCIHGSTIESNDSYNKNILPQSLLVRNQLILCVFTAPIKLSWTKQSDLIFAPSTLNNESIHAILCVYNKICVNNKILVDKKIELRGTNIMKDSNESEILGKCFRECIAYELFAMCFIIRIKLLYFGIVTSEIMCKLHGFIENENENNNNNNKWVEFQNENNIKFMHLNTFIHFETILILCGGTMKPLNHNFVMEIGFQITRTNAIYVLKLLHEYASRIICYVIETICSSFLFMNNILMLTSTFTATSNFCGKNFVLPELSIGFVYIYHLKNQCGHIMQKSYGRLHQKSYGRQTNIKII